MGSHSTVQADSRAVFEGTPRVEEVEPQAELGGTAERTENVRWCWGSVVRTENADATAESEHITAPDFIFVFRFILNFKNCFYLDLGFLHDFAIADRSCPISSYTYCGI
jgi:hypothetical protein